MAGELGDHGSVAIAKVAMPLGRSSEALALTAGDTSDADLARLFERSGADTWLKFVGDRADGDGPTRMAKRACT